jgi:hypothetical protein
MKTIIKLLIAAAIVNAVARFGMSAMSQYQFRDTVQEILLFGGSETEGEITEAIMQAAAEHDVPLEPASLEVQRSGMLTTAEATYVDRIELFPRYVYPMTWTFKLDARRIAGASR